RWSARKRVAARPCDSCAMTRRSKAPVPWGCIRSAKEPATREASSAQRSTACGPPRRSSGVTRPWRSARRSGRIEHDHLIVDRLHSLDARYDSFRVMLELKMRHLPRQRELAGVEAAADALEKKIRALAQPPF